MKTPEERFKRRQELKRNGLAIAKHVNTLEAARVATEQQLKIDVDIANAGDDVLIDRWIPDPKAVVRKKKMQMKARESLLAAQIKERQKQNKLKW